MTVTTDANVSDGEYIFFFKAEGMNGFLSQWYHSPFTDGKNQFSNAEQFMMYSKAVFFGDNETAQMILNTPDSHPAIHKRMGRRVRNFDAEAWGKVDTNTVAAGNFYKFTQNNELMTMLVNTTKRELVEASPYDRVWGIGFSSEDAVTNVNNWGQNKLGVALMMVRDVIEERIANASMN